MTQWVKNPPAMQETQETWVQFLGHEDALEEKMITHSNILVQKILQLEEPGRLPSMGLQRVRHIWATKPTHKGSVYIKILLWTYRKKYEIFSNIKSTFLMLP